MNEKQPTSTLICLRYLGHKIQEWTSNLDQKHAGLKAQLAQTGQNHLKKARNKVADFKPNFWWYLMTSKSKEMNSKMTTHPEASPLDRESLQLIYWKHCPLKKMNLPSPLKKMNLLKSAFQDPDLHLDLKNAKCQMPLPLSRRSKTQNLLSFSERVECGFSFSRRQMKCRWATREKIQDASILLQSQFRTELLTTDLHTCAQVSQKQLKAVTPKTLWLCPALHCHSVRPPLHRGSHLVSVGHSGNGDTTYWQKTSRVWVSILSEESMGEYSLRGGLSFLSSWVFSPRWSVFCIPSILSEVVRLLYPLSILWVFSPRWSVFCILWSQLTHKRQFQHNKEVLVQTRKCHQISVTQMFCPKPKSWKDSFQVSTFWGVPHGGWNYWFLWMRIGSKRNQ